MTGHVERIEKALNGGNRFRRSDVSDLLAENMRLRVAMEELSKHPTQSAALRMVGLPPGITEVSYVSCNGYPMCHHCWASKQLKHITKPAASGPKEDDRG